MPPTIAVSTRSLRIASHAMMQSDERRRAGRIDGEARPTQIKYIRNTVGDNTQRVAGHKIRIGAGRIPEPQIRIVGCGCTNIDSGRTPRNFSGRNAGILECVPCQLQQQPLLGIHLCRFAREMPKKDGSNRSMPLISPAAQV